MRKIVLTTIRGGESQKGRMTGWDGLPADEGRSGPPCLLERPAHCVNNLVMQNT
jgi:hypothetical protein